MSRSTPTHTFHVGSMPGCDGSRRTSQGAPVIKILWRYHSERTLKMNSSRRWWRNCRWRRRSERWMKDWSWEGSRNDFQHINSIVLRSFFPLIFLFCCGINKFWQHAGHCAQSAGAILQSSSAGWAWLAFKAIDQRTICERSRGPFGGSAQYHQGFHRKVTGGEREEDLSWWMKLTEEGGALAIYQKNTRWQRWWTESRDCRKSQLKTRTSPLMEWREVDFVSLPPQSSGGNGGGSIFGDRESGDILQTRGSSGMPYSPLRARRPEPGHFPHTTDPKTEADICGSLHFLTAHELKGKATSVSSSSRTRHTLLQLSCFATHWFIHEPGCGVKYINSSKNDNIGWWRLNLNFFDLRFQQQSIKTTNLEDKPSVVSSLWLNLNISIIY